jgi:hypothetical protein
MRRAALFAILIMSVAAVAAWAEAPVPLDKAQFLASLGTPQPVEASGGGGVTTKSTCTVDLTCDVGSYHISCTSPSGNCSSGSTWVTCDGNTTNCPICAVSVLCCDGTSYHCVGWSSCDDSADRSVTCDGHIHGYCPRPVNCP